MKQEMLTNEQVCSFCTALEQMIRAGIGLGDALVLLKEDEQDARCRQMLEQMARRADDGATLSAVIRETERFPSYVSTLTEVGERAGKIEQTLQALSRYYESRERMDRYVRASLIYPAALMTVLLAVAVVLLVWVLPVFNDVYERLGSSLTGVAGALLALGTALRKSLPVICVVIAFFAGVLAIKPLRQWLLRLWKQFFGDRGADRAVLSARFVQALALAVSSGMTASEAVNLACSLSEGEAPAFRKRCRECCDKVENGSALPQALSEAGFLTAADRRLLDAGNRSGNGELMLQKIGSRMLDSSEDALQRRTGYIEPVVVGIACLLIGTVLLSVMLPLMHIMSAIG